MSRELPEWIGKTDSSAIPPRVQLRVYERYNGQCAICQRKVRGRADYEIDHRVALINGGANAELNLQICCVWCHGKKSRDDVAEKARTSRIRQKHLGIWTSKGRPLQGTKRSGIRKRMDGTVEYR